MIRRNDFFHIGPSNVFLEKQGGFDAAEKVIAKEANEKVGKSPVQRVLEAKGRLEATKAKFKDFSPEERQKIFEAGKTPLLSTRTTAANQASDALRNDIESTPSESLQHFMDRHGVEVELPTQLQTITEKTTKTDDFDGLDTAFALGTLTSIRRTSETTHESSWNPNDPVEVEVDMGTERGGVQKVQLGTVGALLANREGPEGMMGGIVAKLDEWWAKEQLPRLTQKKQDSPAANIPGTISQTNVVSKDLPSPLRTEPEAPVLSSKDLAERGQANKESTTTPKNA